MKISNSIIIKNASENNLKNININIPLDAFTCITGCSGSGKSSLVYDTIYAESQRNFLESMSRYMYGQKLMNKPKVDFIDNLRPALNVSQNYYNVNPRSTVGTVTDISYYLRTMYALINSTNSNVMHENFFSSNNPDSFCTHCMGLGVETVVSERLIVPDLDISLDDGGIIFYKGSDDSKEKNMLKEICDYYHIDISKKISELNEIELFNLLYNEEAIKVKIKYKEGKKRKCHYVQIKGVIPMINEKIKMYDRTNGNHPYVKYVEEIKCQVCQGKKLNSKVLSYKVSGKNYYQVENMEINDLFRWLSDFNYQNIKTNKIEIIQQLVNIILKKLQALISLKLSYLSLSRSIPTLSSGERQRVRIATQLTCSLKGLIYILDEPCKGLHYLDVKSIIEATQKLIDCQNTVIAIEHNEQYIESADNIIELGPVGGPLGGFVIDERKGKKFYSPTIVFDEEQYIDEYFEFSNINFRNINKQNVKIPKGCLTCFTGVSGSGKSTLLHVVKSCFEGKAANYCDWFSGNNGIRKVVSVNQAPIGKTPRSTIVSYLGIYDEIRTIFSKTDAAKKSKMNASMFSINTKGGRCENCQGTGYQKIDMSYLPSTYIKCSVCEGKRFIDKILKITYNEKNIQEILDSSIEDIIPLFMQNKKIYNVLKYMKELGLGYLKLGQMSMNLSGGEAQRIKLAKALGTQSLGKTLYIFDEPTTGLNKTDIEHFKNVLFRLKENKETVLIVEHNLEFIASISDYIIDFGINSGNKGGVIQSCGTPKEVFKDQKSSVFKALNK